MTQKKIEPYWPELPRGRGDIDHVRDLLLEWAKLAELTPAEAGEANFDKSPNILHIIEGALLLYLAPYASRRRFDSTIFKNCKELDQVCGAVVFEPGYRLEMAEALRTCFSLEKP